MFHRFIGEHRETGMWHAVVMKAGAVVMVLFGLALLLVPNGLMAFYKAAPLNSTGIYNTMLYGGTLIAMALMNWRGSTAPLAAERRVVVLGTFVGSVIALAVALIRSLTVEGMPPMSWLNVVIFGVYSVLYGVLLGATNREALSGLPTRPDARQPR
jgi:hypothetical protein